MILIKHTCALLHLCLHPSESQGGVYGDFLLTLMDGMLRGALTFTLFLLETKQCPVGHWRAKL